MTTTPNKVERELHSLEPSAIIELFELHLTAAVNGVDLIYYYHAGTNELSQDIVFNGKTYAAVPIEVDGFAVTTKGTLPRPKMKIANANNAITALLNSYNPLQAEVRRIRTCKKFLDAVNFSSGTNSSADPTAMFGGGYESWYIDRVATENIELVEFELVGKLDLTNLRLPSRQIVEHCPWVYKGKECGYKPGKKFDLQNKQVFTASQDQCAKNLKACELRHPKGKGIGPDEKLLPFGGFPGARLQV
jgi:lambda family phage minor tail protein L|tara:strand:- start:252 stop:992 length:741 start_codon:yes stop_codon:yes gene_type:complete